MIELEKSPSVSSEGWGKINGIRAKRVAELSTLTREQWVEYRRAGLGGSDVAAVCGVHPYSTALDVYISKVLPPVEDRSEGEKEIMYWGNQFESAIAEAYAEKTGNEQQRVRAILQHPEHPWMLANLDRLIIPSGGGPRGVLECKLVSNHHEIPHWSDDEIPPYRTMQVQWYLTITGLEWGQFATVLGSRRLVVPVYRYDPDVEDAMLKIAHVFWHENVLGKVPPSPSGELPEAEKRALNRLFPSATGERIALPDDVGELLEAIQEKSKVAKEIGEEIDAMKNRVMAAMGTASVGYYGALEARWPTVQRKSYTVEAGEYRKFSIAKNKETK